MLLEHMRNRAIDILEFSRNAKHNSPEWPVDYWPKSEGPPNGGAWDASVKSFRADLKAMQDLVANPKTDLFARIPWGDGQTILREALLIADHNAYHLGQLVDVRRLLGCGLSNRQAESGAFRHHVRSWRLDSGACGRPRG